jgi:hypothetical protein
MGRVEIAGGIALDNTPVESGHHRLEIPRTGTYVAERGCKGVGGSGNGCQENEDQ